MCVDLKLKPISPGSVGGKQTSIIPLNWSKLSRYSHGSLNSVLIEAILITWATRNARVSQAGQYRGDTFKFNNLQPRTHSETCTSFTAIQITSYITFIHTSVQLYSLHCKYIQTSVCTECYAVMRIRVQRGKLGQRQDVLKHQTYNTEIRCLL